MLEGSWAELVCDTRNGTRHIEPMLIVTRTWNAITSVAFMRRAVELAKSYARQREAFGSLLCEQPLHVETLANLEAETRGAFLMAFELVELVGRHEHGELDDEGRALMRLLTPLAKSLTAKQAVAVVSEAIEAFGGAGYVEDTGLPVLLRDTQVLPIWEGTTNVLSLDALLRGDLKSALAALEARFERCASGVSHGDLTSLAKQSLDALANVRGWLASNPAPPQLQAGARRLAFTLGRAWQLMLLVEQAQWQLDHDQDHTSRIAAKRFALSPIDVLASAADFEESRALLGWQVRSPV